MAGRYTDWTHTRVLGAPREAGAPYVGEARKLLGEVFEQAAVNGLGVHKLQRKLQDGTVIVAEKHGEIPRMTIVPVPSAGEALRRTVEGFYFTWMDTSVDGRTPVMLLEPPAPLGDEKWKDWRSMFFSSSAAGYGATPDDRRAGTYIDVFGIKAKTPGARFWPGNGTWEDPQTGEIVSWFRGYNGYWPEHYRHPVTNYAGKVSIYGHPVINVADPFRVMAAAMRDGWLYMLIGEDLGHLSPPAMPAAPSYSGQVWYSQPYTDDLYTYAVWRAPLVVGVEPDTGVETYRADGAAAERLGGAQIELAYGAWSFNHDCTQVVTVQLPRIAVWSTPYVNNAGLWQASPVELDTYPQVEAQRIVMTLDQSSNPPTLASITGSVAPSLVAEEDGVQLEIVTEFDTAPYFLIYYKCGAWTLPATEIQVEAGTEWYDRRILVHAHLPSKTFLFYRWRTDLFPAGHVTAGYELYVDGVAVPITDPGAIDTSFNAVGLDAETAAAFKPTMSLSYNGTSPWYRAMDAMTYLLGFTFKTQGLELASDPPKIPSAAFAWFPHVPFYRTAYPAHTAAGGYVFGSVAGGASEQFWVLGASFPKEYGANNGAYADTAPIGASLNSIQGSAVSAAGNTLAAVQVLPNYSVSYGGVVSELNAMTGEHREIRLGTNGDAATLLDGVMSGLPTYYGAFVLGHTGNPRKTQRGVFKES